MRISESRIRRIIREEATALLGRNRAGGRRGLRENEGMDDGEWDVSDHGYSLHSGDSILDESFSSLVYALTKLAGHKSRSFYDPESGRQMTVDEAVNHMIDTIYNEA